jgi:hypothetical protein
MLVAMITVTLAIAGGAQSRETAPWSVHTVTHQSTRGPGTGGLSALRTGISARWCGAPSQRDLEPNAVAGFATHWIHAIPSDGTDSFATYASAMQSDAETIDAWWRSQDPTRTPRNDLTPLSCGLQLDLTQIRLSQSGAELAAYDTRFVQIADALEALGFSSRHTKYVVYYDGPATPGICGEGGSHEDGHGYAVVYVRGCSGVPLGTIAAHELLHTLGAVAAGAPNECLRPLDGHVCDDMKDIMYPFGDETPLGALKLDAGRDDYYGHAGTQLDVQDSPWLVQLDRQIQLTLAISGPGSITADVPGLRCTRTCTTAWNADTDLVLTAEPGIGAKLVRWGEGCQGSAGCSVTMTRGTDVSALFAPSQVTIRVALSGKGTVRGSRPGIACPATCSALVPSYESLRLTAKPARGWRLARWKGSCRGRAIACLLLMTADTSARAIFVRAP